MYFPCTIVGHVAVLGNRECGSTHQAWFSNLTHRVLNIVEDAYTSGMTKRMLTRVINMLTPCQCLVRTPSIYATPSTVHQRGVLVWSDSTLSADNAGKGQITEISVASLRSEYKLNDVQVWSGGILNNCNDQLITWMTTCGIIEPVMGEGTYPALGQPVLGSTPNPHKGNRYKDTGDTCPHAVIIGGSCNDVFPLNNAAATNCGVEDLYQPYKHVSQQRWDDLHLFTPLIKVCPHSIIVGPGEYNVWYVPGFTNCCNPVFTSLGDQRVTTLTLMHWYSNMEKRDAWYFVNSSHNVETPTNNMSLSCSLLRSVLTFNHSHNLRMHTVLHH